MKNQQNLSISRLAAELKCDRRTLTKHLAGVEPSAVVRGRKLYRLRDAITALDEGMNPMRRKAHTGPLPNILRLTAAVASEATFHFLSEDKLGFVGSIPVAAKDLGIDASKAEKLAAHVWTIAAIRMQRFLSEQWIDLAIEARGEISLDDLFRKLFPHEPAPWSRQTPEFTPPDMVQKLAKKHWPKAE